jgi:hypothetical protein
VGVLFEDKGGQVNLLVPAHVPRPFGYEPEFQTYQAISPGGQSSLAPGCPGNGAVFMVDGDRHDRRLDHEYATWIEKGRDPARRPVILVAEDLPSAKTLHDASGRPVACAFNGDNLRPASENLRKAYPAAILVVCANSGQGGKDGHGPDAGRKAAAGIGAYALALKFSDEEAAKNMTNYNDIAKIHGMNKFKAYFSKLMHRLRLEKTCYKSKYFKNININSKIYSSIFLKNKNISLNI